MSTENEISADDRRKVDLPALVEAVTYQVLKNVALALISEGATQAHKLASGAELPDASSEISFYDEVRRFEIGLIRRALEQTGGHQSRAARLLGMNATTLNSKIKQYQILGSERASDSPQPPRDGGDSCSARA